MSAMRCRTGLIAPGRAAAEQNKAASDAALAAFREAIGG